jgi:LysM repeat protein
MQTHTVLVRVALLIGLIASLALAGSALAQGGAVVRIDPAAATAAPGQTVTLSVKVDNVTNMIGAEIHLAFNPNVLEVIDDRQDQAGVQVTNGGLLRADVVAQNSADNASGTIDFAIAQNPPAVTGSGTLVTINFRAKAAGVSPVTFRSVPAATTGVILSDANGAALAVTTQSGSVTVTGSGVTVTPTSTGTTTATPTASPTPGSGAPGRHTVRQGETLFCIGRAYGVLPWAIAMANGIHNPNRLIIGQVLVIPNAPWNPIPPGPVCPRQFQGTPPPVTITPTPPPPPACRALHTVVFGDTLLAISRKYNVNVWTLAARNNIYNLNLIYVGQVLCIP